MRRRPLLLALLLAVVAAATVVVSTVYAPPADRDDGSDRVTGVVATAEHTVTFRNEMSERIWIGATANADGSAPLTGLPTLDPGQSATITVPENSGAGHWRGKFFARQGCGGEEGSTFHCAVADCGPHADRCTTGEQPASLAEFNFDPADARAPWYNVSYVNAVSSTITITPDGAAPPENGGECAEVGCPGDLLAACPPENLTTDPATGKPLVCVNPDRDAKTAYSEALTAQCPKAYAWSKHDTEPGNEVVRQCAQCTGMTVTFHGAGGGPDAPAPAPDHTLTPDPGTPVSSDGKGVSLNPVDGAARALADSGASWYYNWTSSTGEVAKPEGVEYVPMIWGPGSVTDAELDRAAREGTHLLGFNEPDSPAQAGMSPEQALDLWPRLERTGLRLGAPAVATGAEVPGGWLDRFMTGAAERGLRVDFIPLHWYGADFGPAAVGQLRDYLQAVHDRYGKPVWLTEYALIDFSRETPRYPSEQEQTAFIASSTEMLEGLDFVERYAWFALSTETSPTGLYDGATVNAGGRTYREAD
ncbi:glycosyl hydrolase [Streptomyces sp. TRM 70361]|uniref:glycosyl hydrolase n=1 Tax=Streptomyces sp. TRM 70361 TaxID=3116553 RepID=UPI002E7B5B14|nr:glycosyl hydrolase [Streptomyces sp. TRM 70361]MEE1940994.1 glycosyl hydrolase [Streptomyces sp. TRM 70361]